MPKSRPPYSPALRRRLAEMVRAGTSPVALPELLEPSEYGIRNWVRQAERDEGEREDDLTSAEKKELARPHCQNRRLREGRAILAAAAALFARETGRIPPGSSSS